MTQVSDRYGGWTAKHFYERAVAAVKQAAGPLLFVARPEAPELTLAHAERLGRLGVGEPAVCSL